VGSIGSGGIHGAHLDPNMEIRYRATDAKRQTIPWVSWRNRQTGEIREYGTGGASKSMEEAVTMQCADCHNRPAHTFEQPDRAVDEALASGLIDPSLPFIKKNALAALKASYSSHAEADRAIRSAFGSQYPNKPGAQSAAATVSAIYARNVFPEMKVTWGTYANDLGHTNSPGCFRCHDSEHKTAKGKEIGQDCASCHELLAVEETDPEILKKLNLTWRTR
jgi:formate-dependent nitrite reductase cytochrome c552 subunit